MKVLLLFPPGWHPIMPHIAVPALTAFLRQEGVNVVQKDLNIELYDEVLSKRHLSAVVRSLERESRTRRGAADAPQASAEALAWAISQGQSIANRVESAKALLRSPRFYQPEGLAAFATIHDALDLASIPYAPSRLGLTGYDSAYPIDASRGILAAVRDRRRNLFYDIFRRTTIPWIAKQGPDIIGISVTSAHQVISSFTLAALIKEAGLKAHVVLGGKMITCWRDLLPRAPQLFDLFDSAVVFAGERALLRLVEAVDRRQNLAVVPNLLYRERGRVQVNEVCAPISVNQLPFPDYEGLPMRGYLAPEPALPVSASRGCYWHRCAFCNVGHGESKSYEERNVERVLEEIKSLARAYGSNRFFFCDEAVSPRMLKLLSRRILADGSDLRWTCAARFEPSLDADTLRRLAAAGCKMLMFGLESASQRILDRMDKGTSLEIARRILKEGTEAGIWNHIFFFFGFPGETAAEAQETINFLYANRQYVHSICSGTFMLERHSKVYEDPARYDVTRLVEHYERDLPYYYDYDVACGISAEQAEQIEDKFIEGLPRKALAHIYSHDIYRFLYACRFEAGTPFPTMV